MGEEDRLLAAVRELARRAEHFQWASEFPRRREVISRLPYILFFLYKLACNGLFFKICSIARQAGSFVLLSLFYHLQEMQCFTILALHHTLTPC
jgi:hypothetical protein